MAYPERSALVHLALSSAPRRELLELIRRSPEPPTAAQLAEHMGLHVTSARFHLDQLEAAGLIERQTWHGGGRGRPAVRYLARGGRIEDAREQMIAALAHALAERDAGPAHDGADPGGARVAGHRWAERIAESAQHDPTTADQAVVTEFEQLGFQPEAQDARILLHSCPFREAARENPDIVCGTHLGLAEGLAERAEPGTSTTLQPFVTPDLCVLTLHRPGPQPTP